MPIFPIIGKCPKCGRRNFFDGVQKAKPPAPAIECQLRSEIEEWKDRAAMAESGVIALEIQIEKLGHIPVTKKDREDFDPDDCPLPKAED